MVVLAIDQVDLHHIDSATPLKTVMTLDLLLDMAQNILKLTFKANINMMMTAIKIQLHIVTWL